MKKMKHISVFTLFFLTTASLLSQSSSLEIQREIDREVWVPFHRAFEAMDATTFNNLYADEVIRVTPAGIDTEETFKEKNKERFRQGKAKGTTRKLDFWFESRHTDQHTSYEVGLFKITSSDPGSESITFYGQFHIVIEQIDGEWKITQDWDSDQLNGQKITEEDFNKQEPIIFR